MENPHIAFFLNFKIPSSMVKFLLSPLKIACFNTEGTTLLKGGGVVETQRRTILLPITTWGCLQSSLCILNCALPERLTYSEHMHILPTAKQVENWSICLDIPHLIQLKWPIFTQIYTCKIDSLIFLWIIASSLIFTLNKWYRKI